VLASSAAAEPPAHPARRPRPHGPGRLDPRRDPERRRRERARGAEQRALRGSQGELPRRRRGHLPCWCAGPGARSRRVASVRVPDPALPVHDFLAPTWIGRSADGSAAFDRLCPLPALDPRDGATR